MIGHIVEEMDPQTSKYCVQISDGKKISINLNNFFKVEDDLKVPMMKIDVLCNKENQIYDNLVM